MRCTLPFQDMRRLYPLYPVALGLLVGGNALYTFLATPVIFASFERDLAGSVVAAMMPYYFGYEAALVALAIAVLSVAGERGARAFRASLWLLAAALAVSAVVTGWLYPAMVEVRAQVASFGADAPMTAARSSFRRLHGLSQGLNLAQLVAGAAALWLSPRCAPKTPPSS
jgi:hypothetical protein